MIPAARISALIELVETVEIAIAEAAKPADALLSEYFRARRYAGSKDRRAVSEQLYRMLRSRELLLWCLGMLKVDKTARTMVLVDMALNHEDTSVFGLEQTHAPAALSGDESDMLERAKGLNLELAPASAMGNVPALYDAAFQERFKGEYAEAADALNGRAPLNIRVNSLKYDAKETPELFESKDINTSDCVYSPIGKTILDRVNLVAEKAHREGFVEVQDEAAQIASLLVHARPGMQVMDLCAGAGGKSLAVADAMEGKGQIHAYDTHAGRLRELGNRSQRAGAHNIQSRKLPESGEARAAMLDEHNAGMDRVMVDVPCSGSGTWRRSPDLRWRFDAASLDAITQVQADLIAEAAAMVKVGGRLIYMTCSVLPDENEEIVESFLKDHKDFKMIPWQDVWSRVAPHNPLSGSLALKRSMLQLAPHIHHTDGFFVAILQRLA